MARHSLVNSSITTRIRSCLPSSVRSVHLTDPSFRDLLMPQGPPDGFHRPTATLGARQFGQAASLRISMSCPGPDPPPASSAPNSHFRTPEVASPSPDPGRRDHRLAAVPGPPAVVRLLADTQPSADVGNGRTLPEVHISLPKQAHDLLCTASLLHQRTLSSPTWGTRFLSQELDQDLGRGQATATA